MLKRTINILISLLFAAVIITLSGFAGSAVTVNQHEVHEGDTIEYSVHAVACPSGIQAIDMSVFYDSASLEYVSDSASAPAVPDAMMNTEPLGEVRYNAISVDGYDFSDDSVLLTLKFKVKDELTSDISLYYTAKSFIDNNGSDLKDVYTYDITYVDEIAADTLSSVPAVSSAVSEITSESKADDKSSSAVSSASDIDISVSETESIVSTDPSGVVSMTSHATQDIPLDRAIKFDSPDTPQKSGGINKYKTGVIFCIVGIIILIGVIVVIMLKDNSKGRHFDK